MVYSERCQELCKAGQVIVFVLMGTRVGLWYTNNGLSTFCLSRIQYFNENRNMWIKRLQMRSMLWIFLRRKENTFYRGAVRKSKCRVWPVRSLDSTTPGRCRKNSSWRPCEKIRNLSLIWSKLKSWEVCEQVIVRIIISGD